MLKTGVFILVIFKCVTCQAQIGTITKSPDRRNNFKFSYISSLIYPGISTGIEIPIRMVKKSGFRNQSNRKSVTKDRFIAGNLNWYHHPGFHNNLYLTTEWAMQRTGYKGFTSEFSSGIGYNRTFLAGTTYRVNDNGNISIIKLAGYNYVVITIGGGIGYDFSKKQQLPLLTFAKMNLIAMFPYNNTIYPRPVLELGVRYTPGLIFHK
jgi:hypothetical protein